MSFRIPSIHEIDYIKNPNFKIINKVPLGKAGSKFTPRGRRKSNSVARFNYPQHYNKLYQD
jgi:hypothetical protein